MIYSVSNISGRTRLRFSDILEKEKFILNINKIDGLKQLDDRARRKLTVLVRYKTDSPADYFINKILSRQPRSKIFKNDVSSYVSPLLSNPITKALWLAAIFGPKVGFLQFGISSMIVNRYIKAKFG